MKHRINLVWLMVVSLVVMAASPPRPVFDTPTLIRYGNYKGPGLPAKPPTFTENDLIGRSPSRVFHLVRSVRENAKGEYVFLEKEGTRQFLWIADKLTKSNLNFSVSGFPWGIYPGPNKPHQSIKVMGVPGKVYVTSDQNNGQYELTVR